MAFWLRSVMTIITVWEKHEQMDLIFFFSLDPCTIDSGMIKLLWNNIDAVCQAGFFIIIISLQINVSDNVWN